MFKISIEDSILAKRVRTVIGVPEVFLQDEIIASPEFKSKADLHINEQLISIQDIKLDENEKGYVDMAGIYYIAYLLSITMPTRLPNRMENISTKTLFQNIDWYKFGNEMLNRCDELLNKVLEDEGKTASLSNTVVALSDETTYPNFYI